MLECVGRVRKLAFSLNVLHRPEEPKNVTSVNILCNGWIPVRRWGMCVITDQPGGEARGAYPGPGVSSEAEGQLPAETQHAAAQQRHAVPAAARRPGRTQ